MQPHDEQPQEQQDRPVASPYTGVPEQVNRPVVTLSPDDTQAVETVYPAAGTPAELKPETDVPAHLQPVRWQATEYIHRERDVMWFVVFVVVTLVLTAVAIFLIKSITFAVLVPVMAAALVVYARRPPGTIDYTLSRQGLHVNDHLYPYAEFKSFALVSGDIQHSIMLIPTKRFKPAVSVYFPEEAGEAIVDMLAARLPMQEVHPDIVDRIIQKLHL